MTRKVIQHHTGDRWTRYDKNTLVLYRDGKECPVCINYVGEWSHEVRLPCETDLPTPEAHAQLREWGYEVRDANPVKKICVSPNDTIIQTTYSLPGGVKVASVTEFAKSRVREIVEEVLAEKAKPTPDCAAQIINDYKSGMCKNMVNNLDSYFKASQKAFTPDDWRARCNVSRGTNGNYTIFSPSGRFWLTKDFEGNISWLHVSALCRDWIDDGKQLEYLAKAPSPPDADFAPEPDWRGLLDAVMNAPSFAAHGMAIKKAAEALSSSGGSNETHRIKWSEANQGHASIQGRQVMGTQQWTPGPWIYQRHDSESQWAGNIVGHYSMEHPRSIRTITCQLKYGTPEEIEANALRIESCVNACGGYSKVNGEWVKTHERMDDPAAEIQRLRAERNRYEAALKEIAKGEGAFSRDPLKHAENVINNSLTIAETALSAKEAE